MSNIQSLRNSELNKAKEQLNSIHQIMLHFSTTQDKSDVELDEDNSFLNNVCNIENFAGEIVKCCSKIKEIYKKFGK